MKLFLKLIAAAALIGLAAWGLVFVSSEENSIHLDNNWGIAKDKPIR